MRETFNLILKNKNKQILEKDIENINDFIYLNHIKLFL